MQRTEDANTIVISAPVLRDEAAVAVAATAGLPREDVVVRAWVVRALGLLHRAEGVVERATAPRSAPCSSSVGGRMRPKKETA